MAKTRTHMQKDYIPNLNTLPTDSIYSSKPLNIESLSQENQNTSPQANKVSAASNPELVRKTYYYTNDLIKAISIVSALEGKDKSQLVREILLESRLKEYIEKIKSL